MYPHLRQAMAEKCVGVTRLAALLGVHRNTLHHKLRGDSEFTLSQARTICAEVFPEYRPEYLFERAGR